MSRVTDNARLYSIRLSIADQTEHEFMQRLIAKTMHEKRLTRAQAMRHILLEWIRNAGNIAVPEHSPAAAAETPVNELREQIRLLWQAIKGLSQHGQYSSLETYQQGIDDSDELSAELLEGMLEDINRMQS